MVIAIPFTLQLVEGWHARPVKETVSSRLFVQPTRSPSGTGRAPLEAPNVTTAGPCNADPAGQPTISLGSRDAVVRVGATVTCDACGAAIDPSGPGVTGSSGTEPWWEPFLEDLRTDPEQHWHPRCFATAYGVDALIDLVHREDLRRR
jgi:hypothetical protein